MDYKYILDKLDYISYNGTTIIGDRYDPALNVSVMIREIHKLIQTIQDEVNKEYELLNNEKGITRNKV